VPITEIFSAIAEIVVPRNGTVGIYAAGCQRRLTDPQ